VAGKQDRAGVYGICQCQTATAGPFRAIKKYSCATAVTSLFLVNFQTLINSLKSSQATATSLPSPPPATPTSSSSLASSASSAAAFPQAEVEQLRRHLAAAQAERDSVRAEQDRFRQQLQSSDEAIARVHSEF
jgi:hypothetical protein